jgi:eukaryotic-like serine/threonine-protein kinase
MVLKVGDKLQNGTYTIEKRYPPDRFSTYVASKLNGERRVIKNLNPQRLAELALLNPPEDGRLREQFWKEAVNLARCNSSRHIVQVDTPFEENGVSYLPMEYIDGNSLADRNPRVMSEELALKYIRQVGEALELVHANGLIHCDIRPANILLKSSGEKQDAVLTNFGLALDFDAQLTQTRAEERVEGFSAPELYTKIKPVGAYTDIYSLAATLYDLVTGVPPIGVRERASKKLESPQSKNPEISANTSKVILLGMETNPEKRPDSVQAWLDKLPAAKLVISTEIPVKKIPKINWQTFWVATGVIVAFFTFITTALGIIPSWLNLFGIQPSTSIPKSSATPSSMRQSEASIK